MNDDNYTFGLTSDLPRGHDDRADYRLAARATATLRLEAFEPPLDRPPGINSQHLVQCRVRDISISGLSLKLPEPVPEGAILMATLSLGAQSRQYDLCVEIVWCRISEDGHLAGARVLPSEETDYLVWVEAVAEALAG